MRRELTRKFLPVHYRWKNILESLKS
jgi:hypothetical protein